MTQAVVHLRCNAGKAKIEKRDGRETIIVPSYAAKANTVLNGLMYPKEALEASFDGLDRTPAPFGHPTVNGKFLSARDPEGMVRGFVGAWNERPAWDGDRIAINVAIDKQRAQESEQGKRLLEAVNKGEPISTSTGLFCNIEDAPEGSDYEGVVSNIEWDHIAILMDEEPAIGTDQGVGIYVNGKNEEIKVINSALDRADDELDWAGMHLLSALERRERASAWERIKSAIMEAIKGSDGGETSAIKGEADMADEKQLEELSAKVNAVEESMKGIGETIANAVKEAVKPLTDNLEELKANQNAKDEAEKDDLVNKIVKANLLSEDAAKELTLNAARELAKKAEPGKAAAMNGAGAGGEEPGTYDFNKVMGLTNEEAK